MGRSKLITRYGRYHKRLPFWTFFLLAAIVAYWIVAGIQVYATDTDNEIDGTVTAGSTDNRIVISVTNPSGEIPIHDAKLEIVENGRWITNIRIQADKTGPIAPKSTRRFTVLFDISTDAEKDVIDRITLRITAQGALVDHPEQEIAVKIVRAGKPLVAAYPLKPDAPDRFPIEEAARYCALEVSKINEYDKIVVFFTPGRILSKSNPEEFRFRIKNPNGKVVSRWEFINTSPGAEERPIDLKLLGPDSPGRFAVALNLWNSDLLPKDPAKRWYIPGKYTVETIRLSPSVGTGALGQGQGYREEGEWQEEGSFEVGEGRIHFAGFVTEPVSNRSLPRTDSRWEGEANIENLKVDIETGDVDLNISSWWRNTKRRGDGNSGPGDKTSRGRTHLTMVFPQSIRPGKVIQKFDGKGSFGYPKEPVAEVEIEWKVEGDKYTGYTPLFLRPVPCRGQPSRQTPSEGWGGRTVIDQSLDVSGAIVNKAWNPTQGRKCVFRVGVCEKYKPFGVPSRTLAWHLHDPDTLWLFPVKFTLSSEVEFYGYGIYRNMPGRYDGPEPEAPPWGKPGSGPGTDVGPEEEAGLPDPDEGARGIPIDPGTLDTNRTDVSRLIREWIAVAEPPENATEGANFRYDQWGRVIGTAADGGIITQTQKPTYALATPEETVWSIRKKLDSVNHCTVEEYVMAKLQNRSLENCRGRYKAPEAVTVENLTGLSLSSAKKKLAGVGLKTRLVAGKPASSKRDEGTVASQDPAPGTRLKRGKDVKLVVYGPYNPMVAVPDVAGLEVKEARTKLEEKGLKARLVAFGPAPSNDLALKVKEVDPKAGSNVAPGTEVTVKVYGKYSPPGVRVPGVVGLPLSDAKTSLSRAGFEIKLRAGSKPSSREQEGTVERQRPDPGTKTKSGSEVFIYIYGPFVETIAVPNLVGIKLADAKRILQNIGLELQPTLLGPAPEPGKAEQVVEQQPSATTQAEAGSSVQVKVYGNYVAPGVTVPDMRGMTLQQAKNALSSSNLKIQPSLIGAAPEASQARKVSSQQPAAGTTVPPGSIVQVKVWGNYEAPGTSIPDVRGMTLSEAKNTLQNVGLAINPSLLGPAPTREKELRVNSQEPAAGQKVNPGSEVKVYVFSKYVPPNEGPGKPFFVVFDINLLWPANLPEIKKAPRGADSATRKRIKAENESKLKRALQDFRIENSVVMPVSKLIGKEVPFPIHIFESGLSKYPRSMFKEGDKFSLPFKGNYIDKKDGNRKNMEGALLLKTKKTFDSTDQVFAVYPDLKAEFQKSDSIFSSVKIGSRSGSFDINNKDGSFHLGPLESGWSDRNKRKALILTKFFIENFFLDFDCFIASAVYKNPMAQELFTLRRFRDIVLLSSEEGRRLVKTYYKYGPALAEKVREHPIISGSIRFVLDWFVGWLNSTDLNDSFSRKVLDSVVVITDKVLSIVIYNESEKEP